PLRRGRGRRRRHRDDRSHADRGLPVERPKAEGGANGRTGADASAPGRDRPQGGSRFRRKWEPRYTRRDLTLANGFTAARIALIPFFALAWYQGDGERALWLFAAAAATDLIDGFLARYLNQRSRLGALLDPIADKMLVGAALLVGVLIGAMPIWFLV